MRLAIQSIGPMYYFAVAFHLKCIAVNMDEKNEGKCAKRHFANSRQLRACAQMRAKCHISIHAITFYKM